MTFDQLEIMEMIVEKGSFKAAAAALHRTQPTLSVAIKKLEAEYDLLLFSRDEYRPKLTDQGKIFYAWAQQCLRSFRALAVVGDELGRKETESHLTVVVDPVADFAALSGLFETCLRGQAPTELTLRTEVLHAGMEALLDGDADFAVASAAGLHADIESVPIGHVTMLPVAAAALLAGAKHEAASLYGLPQIVVRTGKGQALTNDGTSGLLDGGRRCYVTGHTMKISSSHPAFAQPDRSLRRKRSAKTPMKIQISMNQKKKVSTRHSTVVMR